MKHLFVPEDIAKQLSDLGFNEPCFAIYYKTIVEGKDDFKIYNIPNVRNKSPELTLLSVDAVTAPLYQQVVDWFRLNHNLFISIDHVNRPQLNMWGYDIGRVIGGGIIDLWNPDKSIKDYYENFNNAIKSAIQIIKR